METKMHYLYSSKCIVMMLLLRTFLQKNTFYKTPVPYYIIHNAKKTKFRCLDSI